MVSPRPDPPGARRPHDSCARRYPLPVLARLLEAELVEVVCEDDTLALAVDPIFDRAVAAALAGLDDADRAWESAADDLWDQLRPAS